ITLVPVSSNTVNGVTSVVFRELAASKPDMACVRLTLSAEKMKSGVVKTTRKLEVPIMRIIPAGAVSADGRVAAPEVSHVETDIRTRFHHPLSTATERADSLRMGNHADCSGNAAANAGVNAQNNVANNYRDVGANFQIPYADVNYVWPSA
ncbi:hypothetical protein, partial [Undibacterium sp. RuTC16W]|uniref:hypothetical protein n=1 Tax=Undibacterium sp. RuTC16W TaxID=3413048 RepID=UPI003BF0B445